MQRNLILLTAFYYRVRLHWHTQKFLFIKNLILEQRVKQLVSNEDFGYYLLKNGNILFV